MNNFYEHFGSKSNDMSEIIQVGGADDRYLSILSEEREELESSFESALASIDQLIKFYSLNPEDENAQDQYIEIIRSLSIDPTKISRSTSKTFRLEKEFQKLYRERLASLKKLNLTSFDKVSSNLESLYDQNMKNSEIQSLEKSLDGINPIELESSETLTLDLSKEQLLEMLQIEKDRRAKISFLNERVYEPNIKELEASYDRWSSREKDLKKFLTVDLEKINKQIQNVKKTESLDL